MHLRAGAGTDPGLKRTLNEDVYAVSVPQGLFVVCDGMGGAPAGEVASRVAADVILDRLGRARAGGEGPGHDGYLPRTSELADAVRRSNAVIYAQGQTDPRCAEMGTTVVTAWLDRHIASVAHVGDSRAYLWRHHQLEQITSDHSLGGSAQHVLVRVVGGAPDVDVDLAEVPLQPGDYLLLCSDGLTRMVSEERVAAAIARLRDPQRICDDLIAAANRNGGADNVTVVVVQVVESWWRRLGTRLRRTHA